MTFAIKHVLLLNKYCKTKKCFQNLICYANNFSNEKIHQKNKKKKIKLIEKKNEKVKIMSSFLQGNRKVYCRNIMKYENNLRILKLK